MPKQPTKSKSKKVLPTPSKSKDQLVEEMRAIRAKNNRNWMDLTKLAQQKAPDKAAAIMLDINHVDLAINRACSEFKVGDQRENAAIINELESLRGINNRNWMNLLRLAFAAAESEAVGIMRNIAACDAQVNEITKKL